jgi:hypothetical protein
MNFDFNIRRADLDLTKGQTPPGTPEEIAELNPELKLVCKYESPNEPKSRFYNCSADIAAENEDAAAAATTVFARLFQHLPDIVFNDVEVTAERVEDPNLMENTPETTATVEDKGPIPVSGEYVVICHFRSTEAFFRFNNAFRKHFAEGVLFAAPNKPGRYVAYVVMRAPSSDGLEKAVEGLMRKAFDAHSPERADRFAEVTTNLL